VTAYRVPYPGGRRLSSAGRGIARMGEYISFGGFTMTKNEENALKVKEGLLNGSHYAIHWKWSVSRGTYTYGYDVCTCYIGSYKVGSCNGGGYNMKGTSLAEFINAAYKEELLTLDNADLYGLSRVKEHAYVEGACGLDCMIKILQALGYVIDYYYIGNNDSIYTIKKA
jgi:hypothetical protein